MWLSWRREALVSSEEWMGCSKRMASGEEERDDREEEREEEEREEDERAVAELACNRKRFWPRRKSDEVKRVVVCMVG